MAASHTRVFIFFASVALHATLRGPQEETEHRTHEPDWCQPKLEAQGGATRSEDMDERNDNCCAAELDAKCGGGFDVKVTDDICSRQGTKVTLYEFKCYEDQQEFPFVVVMVIVSIVALCCAAASIARFRYLNFQAPTVPGEKALFSPGERKSLTRSNTGSDNLKNFTARVSDTTKRLSRSSTKSDQLPTLLPHEADANLKGKTVGKSQGTATAPQSIEMIAVHSSDTECSFASDIETHI